MNTQLTCVLLCSLFPMLGCSGLIVDSPEDDASDAIIGGDIDNEDFSVGELNVTDGVTWRCTASLIAPKVLLTAAHCVETADPATGSIRAQFGTTKAGAVWQQAASWTWHPRFDPGSLGDGFDVAVVVLQQPQARPLLPYAHAAPQPSWVGQDVRVVGYGSDNGAAGTGGGTKRHATMRFNGWTDRVIQVGQTGRTVCSGDSGGPAFRNVNGVETIIGVSSHILGQNCTGEGVMSRVDAYATWIDEQVARLVAASEVATDHQPLTSGDRGR